MLSRKIEVNNLNVNKNNYSYFENKRKKNSNNEKKINRNKIIDDLTKISENGLKSDTMIELYEIYEIKDLVNKIDEILLSENFEDYEIFTVLRLNVYFLGIIDNTKKIEDFKELIKIYVNLLKNYLDIIKFVLLDINIKKSDLINISDKELEEKLSKKFEEIWLIKKGNLRLGEYFNQVFGYE